MTEVQASDFGGVFSRAFEDSFSLLGERYTDLGKFKSVTFYVGTSDKIDQLDGIFIDYAKRIGTDHIALLLKYGTQDYSKRLSEMKCFHLTPFEVPAIIYVDRKNKKCYCFSHSDGKLLANALMRLSDTIKTDSNVDCIEVEFALQAAVADLVASFPSLKPVRDLVLRVLRDRSYSIGCSHSRQNK
ncbi:MAG: hypothetical protein Q8N56_02565 [bacterium]|nr:hypothetical protein [bacterium]